MRMRKNVMVLILASIAVTATLALVGIGLSRAPVMMENAVFMESPGDHMNFDGNISTHMNVTHHTHGSAPDECQDMYNLMNITDHMAGMH